MSIYMSLHFPSHIRALSSGYLTQLGIGQTIGIGQNLILSPGIYWIGTLLQICRACPPIKTLSCLRSLYECHKFERFVPGRYDGASRKGTINSLARSDPITHAPPCATTGWETPSLRQYKGCVFTIRHLGGADQGWHCYMQYQGSKSTDNIFPPSKPSKALVYLPHHATPLTCCFRWQWYMQYQGSKLTSNIFPPLRPSDTIVIE